MKHAIDITIHSMYITPVLDVVKKYNADIFRINPADKALMDEKNIPQYNCEIKLYETSDYTLLFNDLKPLVDIYGGSMEYHECRHDEGLNDCSISETYQTE